MSFHDANVVVNGDTEGCLYNNYVAANDGKAGIMTTLWFFSDMK